MAAYISVPRDLTRVKSKIIFNLTKRQLLCFGAAALIGVPSFFFIKSIGSTSLAAMSMIIIMIPMFLLAMYEKSGQPPEKLIRNIVQVCFLRPKQRPYATNNFYAALERQEQLDKEVYRIVNQAKTHPGRAKTDRSGHRQGKAAG